MAVAVFPLRLIVDTTAGPLALGIAACGPTGVVMSSWVGSSSLSTCEDFPRGLSEVLEGAGMPLTSIQEIVIGQGPGSFTGLRIGYSFVKGLSLALGIPIVQVCSLAAYSLAVEGMRGAVVLDARRGELFTQFFSEMGPVGAVSILAVQQLIDTVTSPSFAGHGKPVIIAGPETALPSLGPDWITVSDRISCLNQAAEKGEPYRRQGGSTSPSYVRAIAAQTIEERTQGR